jgi:hypothetical protein
MQLKAGRGYGKFSWLVATAGGLFAAGCTLIEFDRLVPQSAMLDVDTAGIIQICKPTTTSKAAVATKQGNQLAKIQSNTQLVRNAIPQIGSHPVVNAVLQHVQYISTSSIATSRHILTNGQTDEADQVYLASVSKPPPLAASDIVQFGRTLAETVMRNTGGNPDTTNEDAQQFWSNVKAYYTAYYQGNFVNYFAQPVSKPTVQLTISDTEITAAAGVFLELLFDQLLSPTVWTDGSKNYYPGAGSKAPTYLGVFKQTAAKLTTPDGACGMTEAKVNTITYLANTFSTAASGELSVGVKSFGGIEVGLGIFGKLSIGDNSTLTALLQAVASEAVKRLTVAIAAPILEAIEVVPAPQTVQGGPMLAARLSTATTRAQKIQLYSSPFTSASRNAL